MSTKCSDPVQYLLGEHDKIIMNDYLGKNITIHFTGKIHCTQCGKKTNKSFQQGYCYPCFRRLQECNMCIIHPERCEVMNGTCPKDDWAHQQCHSKQIIYISYTSGLKVGITQINNVPSRWIDQGAVAAVAVMQAENRFLCGQVEVALKAHVADKTNWRKMLKESPEPPDLLAAWNKIATDCKAELDKLIETYGETAISYIANPTPQSINYPVLQYPEKITSHSLDKTDTVSGKLQGIKGQYIILDNGVMNIRKFSGYEVEIIFSS